MNRIFDTAKKSSKLLSRRSSYARHNVTTCDLFPSSFPEAQIGMPRTLLLLLQQQQIRWFVAKAKYKLKGFGPNGSMLKICFCYNEHDLYSKPKTHNHEHYQYTKSRCLLTEIQEKTRDEFETCDNLEYYNGTEWLPLTNEKDIVSWKGGMKVLHIRVPSRWDDIHDPHNMRQVVDALILTCKLTDTAPSKTTPYHMELSNNKEISTKQWLLNEAENDQLLQSIILREPGTLDHIVQCLHFDFLWRKLKEVDT